MYEYYQRILYVGIVCILIVFGLFKFDLILEGCVVGYNEEEFFDFVKVVFYFIYSFYVGVFVSISLNEKKICVIFIIF